MKKLILLTFIMTMLLSTSMAFAVTYDESNRTEVDYVEAFCYGEDVRDIVNIEVYNKNETDCYGYDGSPHSISSCVRELKIENLDINSNEFIIRAVPVETTCPAPAMPTVNNFKVSISSNGANISEWYTLDMNDCWGWWCLANGTYNETRCIFGQDWMIGTPVLETLYCRDVVVSNIDEAIGTCPQITHKVSGDVEWMNVTWGWDNSNDYQLPVAIYFLTFSTSRRIKVVNTVYDTLVNVIPTHEVFRNSIGSLMVMNANFLSITYSITEVILILVSVIMLPAIALLLIKWAFEKVMNRPLTRRRR